RTGTDGWHRTGYSWKNRRCNLSKTDPGCLRQRHFFHSQRARTATKCVHQPHDDATNKQRPRHHPKIFQVLPNLFFQKERWHRGDNKGDDGETKWMGKDVAVSAFAAWEGRKKFQEPVPKI